MHIVISRARRREPRPRAQAALVWIACFSTALSCAAPDRPLPDHATVAASVAARADTPETLARALELADVGALALERPPAPAAIDATQAEFWHACAYIYNPAVRSARRMFLAERARRASAGAPGPIALAVEPLDISGANEETDLKLTFDLLGILNLGPAAQAKELANASALQALAELERELWRARFDVDRARVRVAADRAREKALEELLAEAALDRARIDILAQRGWLASSMVEWSWAVQHMVEGSLSEARSDLAMRLSELGQASGLPPSSPALSQVPAMSLRTGDADESDRAARSDLHDEPVPSAVELFDRLPSLRATRLTCALAEANLRLQVARTWPNVRIGPRAIFHPETILTGALLDIELPFPGSQKGEIRAAVEDCERAREAVEDVLLSAVSELESARVRFVEAQSMVDAHMRPTDQASANAWRAARARFAIDANALDGWSFGLEHRLEPLLALIEAREALDIARLDFEEALGAAPVSATVHDVRTAEVVP